MSNIAHYFSQDDASFSVPPRDLLSQYGDAISALLYSSIFFPEFTEVDGSILLKDNIDKAEERFLAARGESKLSLPALEASFNTVEVAYLFRRDNVTSDFIEIKLAKIISDAWQERLIQLYPSRVFSVSVLDPETSGSVYAVQFFEVR